MGTQKNVLLTDRSVSFPAFYVKGKNKTETRELLATHAMYWLKNQVRLGKKGALYFDIDDTIISSNNGVSMYGFTFLQDVFKEFQHIFHIHIVTARPERGRAETIDQLKSKKLYVMHDNLHMLDDKVYDHGTNEDFARFKWTAYLKIREKHGEVIARFGDKMWDVAHFTALYSDRPYLKHVDDTAGYMFSDPRLRGTASYKCPGVGS